MVGHAALDRGIGVRIPASQPTETPLRGRYVAGRFPSAQLGEGETSALIVVGPYEVLVVGLEELIVDRLAAWQFWKSEVDGINAFLLVSHSKAGPDETRLRELAEAASVTLSLDRLERFLAKLGGRSPETTELESWARQAWEAPE